MTFPISQKRTFALVLRSPLTASANSQAFPCYRGAGIGTNWNQNPELSAYKCLKRRIRPQRGKSVRLVGHQCFPEKANNHKEYYSNDCERSDPAPKRTRSDSRKRAEG